MGGKGLLNANQQRRLGTSLRLLRQEMAAVEAWPELAHPGEVQEAIRGLVGRIVPAVEELERALGLPAERPLPPGRRLAAVAEVWATRLEDLHARQLRPYGKVHAELAGALDGKLDALVEMLEGLAAAAGRLPSR
jgi:hypothetical protein